MKRISILLFPLLTILLAACNFTLAADVTPPPGYREPTAVEMQVEATSGPMYPLVPPDPAQGEPIFAEKCTPCHGATGLGDGPQADQLPNSVLPIGSQKVARQATPSQWFEIVTKGNLERFMPPFSSLTDRQRWDVVAYSLSLSTSPDTITQAGDLYRTNCSQCHGEGGHGDGPAAAGMTIPDFNNQEFMAGKSGADFFQSISDGNGSMPPFSDSLSESERWALTDYLRSLTFVSAPLDGTSVEQEPLPATPQVEATPIAKLTEDTADVEPEESTAVVGESQEMGTISGFVMNVSGGEIPSDLEVLLHGFDQMQVVITETAKLAEDGSYLFTDVEMPVGRVFLATIDFQGTTYGSDIAEVEEQGQAVELPIQVYETTTDTSTLFADRLHMFFEQLDEGTLRVVELYIISNPSSKTIVAVDDESPVLKFSLPAEATNIDFQDEVIGERYVLTEDGFGDTLPIRPGMGEYQVLFSYEMPYERKMELAHPVNIPADAVIILVPEDSVSIKGDHIEDAGVRDMQGVIYHMYNGSSLDAGEELRLNVTGRSVASANLSSSSGIVIGIAAFGIVLIIAGVWLYRRAATGEGDGENAVLEMPDEEAPQSASAVMDAILALDDLYQDGQLPEGAYLKRRSELKTQLAALMKDEDDRV